MARPYPHLPRTPRTKLIQARERQGLKRRDLAQILGVSQQFVMRVEDGLRGARLPMMVRWADALKTRMDVFREDDPPSQAAA